MPLTHSDFNHLLSSIKALSPEELPQFRRQLDRQLAQPKKRPASVKAAADVEETAYDVASLRRADGLLQGGPSPRSPTDLATNPKHMEGFGRD